MADREQVLRERTFKDDAETVGQRVYYTIIGEPATPEKTADQALRLHRTIKAVSLLFERLEKDRVLSADALDDILIELT